MGKVLRVKQQVLYYVWLDETVEIPVTDEEFAEQDAEGLWFDIRHSNRWYDVQRQGLDDPFKDVKGYLESEFVDITDTVDVALVESEETR